MSGLSLAGLLAGHVLADFYLQSDEMAKKKESSLRALMLHCAIYAIVMLPFSFLFIAPKHIVLAWIVVSILHALVDHLKHICMRGWRAEGLAREGQEDATPKSRQISSLMGLCVDQGIHIACCVTVAYLFGEGSVGAQYVQYDALLVAFLVILIVVKPGEVFVRNVLELVQGGDFREEGARNEEAKAGRYIGMLERIIIATLTFFGKFDAIAFVFAAKSIARFSQLNEQRFAERYLIGTLSSATFSILVTLLMQQMIIT